MRPIVTNALYPPQTRAPGTGLKLRDILNSCLNPDMDDWHGFRYAPAALPACAQDKRGMAKHRHACWKSIETVMHTCHICGSQADHAEHQPRERMYGWNTPFGYFHCHDCGCLQIDTVPEDLPAYYPDDYYAHDKTPDASPGWVRRTLNRFRLNYRLTGRHAWLETLSWRLGPMPRSVQQQLPYLKRLPTLHRNSRVLDIGCGEHSDWLAALAQCGFQNLTGVDPFLKQTGMREGVRYLNTDLGTLDGHFDLITLHHALEHISDQHAVFRALQQLLAKDGTCMIRIPLVDSQVWDDYGLDWVELDAPRHLYLHSRKSLARLAHAQGFEIVDRYCDSTAFEFAGSEQYRRGIPLMAPDSFWNGPDAGPFDTQTLQAFSDRARAANAAGRCGRGAFFMRRCKP